MAYAGMAQIPAFVSMTYQIVTAVMRLTGCRFQRDSSNSFTEALDESDRAFFLCALHGLSNKTCNTIVEAKSEFLAGHFQSTAETGNFLCRTDCVIVVEFRRVSEAPRKPHAEVHGSLHSSGHNIVHGFAGTDNHV